MNGNGTLNFERKGFLMKIRRQSIASNYDIVYYSWSLMLVTFVVAFMATYCFLAVMEVLGWA